jgi:hypothetical protein
LCYTPDIFVGINEQQKLILYNLEQGMRWALPELNEVVSVSPIHRNTGFVVGGQEAAQLVDIPHSLITQVLRKGLNTSSGLKIVRSFRATDSHALHTIHAVCVSSFF